MYQYLNGSCYKNFAGLARLVEFDQDCLPDAYDHFVVLMD